MHTILLYYKYVYISNPEKLKNDQLELCNKLGLSGRIIVSKEGINGTVEGTNANIRKYILAMKKQKRFADIDFKKSKSPGNSFPRLSVKVRSEIVTLGTGTNSKKFKKGKYLEPSELQKWYKTGKDFVVVDMRNDYEHCVGHFDGSVLLPIKNFREIPQVVDRIADLKDKTVVNVCTGGVRCEKASGYLLERGFKNVYQLHGGIVRYLEKYPDDKFKGSLYVFDGRVALSYSSPGRHVIVGKCDVCGIPSERCLNCENLDCHEHLICCEKCSSNGVFCSDRCKKRANININT